MMALPFFILTGFILAGFTLAGILSAQARSLPYQWGDRHRVA